MKCVDEAGLKRGAEEYLRDFEALRWIRGRILDFFYLTIVTLSESKMLDLKARKEGDCGWVLKLMGKLTA